MVINDGVPNEASGFVNSFGAIRHTIGDKMAQVSQKAMQFLINLCRSLTHPNITNSNMKGELFSYTDPVISTLNDKLGDNLAKVRTLAE